MNITILDTHKKILFISIFNLLKNSANHITADFLQDRLYIQGMDQSHICIFELNISKKWFNTYDIPNNETICFDINKFCSIINVKCDEQHLNIKKTTNDELTIEFISENSSSADFNKCFKMPLIEETYEQLDIPTIEYDVEITLPSKKITEILSQVNSFGDNLNIKCDEQSIHFITNGAVGEITADIHIDTNNVESYAIVEDTTIDATYCLKYVNKMCATNKLSTDVNIGLSNDMPIKISYIFDTLDTTNTLVFYVAPKIVD